ncbi:glutamine dumper 4 [Perilla frutescens var. hirtella]|uniref:Glutamine dumper 4 n=1 Tax=Perilla frutescens var. hirtella TaxID=608512 RepID=A0AAD4P6D3_PERFH|nr:glutamine dumper 4 [Perilla frutescens var. frutescens]KAH6794449.1 glutamine dumper 4 [Perilla frutescens var. hirtella]KAH6828593.1 glutamine dumper 4 [Perilla frutescens var. hirtella]
MGSAAPPSPAQASSWKSPVPYLFCALAAMLGLIAFALLILGCSYWKLSGNLESRDDGETTDVEEGGGAKAAPAGVEEKYLVIMAGQEKPTFLATPTSSRASSFGSKRTTGSSEISLALEENNIVHKSLELRQVGNFEFQAHQSAVNHFQ